MERRATGPWSSQVAVSGLSNERLVETAARTCWTRPPSGSAETKRFRSKASPWIKIASGAPLLMAAANWSCAMALRSNEAKAMASTGSFRQTPMGGSLT